MNTPAYYAAETKRAVEEAFSPERFPNVPIKCIETLLNPYSYNEKRVEALTDLIRYVLPSRLDTAIAERIGYKIKNPPFAANYELDTKSFAEGGSYRVYLLKAPTPELSSWVVKLPKRLRVSPQEYIEQQKGEYEVIKAKFSTLPNLIPAEHYFIMDGRDENPTAAMLQEYKGNLRDIFSEISDVDLRQLLEEQSQFRDELSEFLHVFNANPDLRDNGFDLTGIRNLSVLETNGECHLSLIDPHFIINPSADNIAEVKNRANYLASLLQESSE
jgi:hypothetical protein